MTPDQKRDRLIAAVEDALKGVKKNPEETWQITELRKAAEALEKHAQGDEWAEDEAKLREITG